jgi:hypothetical protein
MKPRGTSRRFVGVFGLTLACSMGCAAEPAPASRVLSAKLGLYYGGQIQERREIPFELDPGQQVHGFRVDFSGPLSRPLPVSWEIDMPGTNKRVRDRQGRVGGRLVRVGALQARVGQRRLDHVFGFEPGDPLGVWSFRVLIENELVIDKSMLVYDRQARAQVLRKLDGL